MKTRCFIFLWVLMVWQVPIFAKLPADSLLSNANNFYKHGNYVMALNKYLEVLKIAETKQNHLQTAQVLCDIAKCYYSLNDRKTGVRWYSKALYLVNEHDLDTLRPNLYYNISVMYNELKQSDLALEYHNKAVALMLPVKDFIGLSKAYSAISDIYTSDRPSKNLNTAKQMISKAEYYAKLSKDTSCMAFANIKYCLFYYAQKKYKEALFYAVESEKMYLKAKYTSGLTGYTEGVMYACRLRIGCLSNLGDKEAYTHLIRWFNFKDSVFHAEKASNMAFYETLYETEKKQKENKLLQQQNELSQLQIQAKNRNFFVLLLIFLLLVAGMLWWINRSRLKKKHRELEMLKEMQNEKERIARDLHDNVGGQLSYIIYSLDGIHNEDEETRIEVTESINQSVRSVIGSLRETIWAISDANIKVSDFSDKLKVFARNLFKHTQTKVVFNESIQQERELNALLGLNIYRICQEILNNAFKHAKASQIIIEFKNNEVGFSISISDNGVGFDVDESSSTSKYGISNIKTRASEFGIAMQLQAEPSKGTNYLLIV